MILAPSLLSADFSRLGQTLQDLEAAGLEWAHWDVMDGVFVPNITFGQPVIRALRAQSRLFFDVHLMIVEPERYLADFKASGADLLVVHVEAGRHLQRCLSEIRRLGMKAGAAINPATPLDCLDHILDDLDLVLLMSVNPGFGGQAFLPATYEKLVRLKQKIGQRKCLIQVDGGVTPENAGQLVEAGADVLVSGSSFFAHPPYAERLARFKAAAGRELVVS